MPSDPVTPPSPVPAPAPLRKGTSSPLRAVAPGRRTRRRDAEPGLPPIEPRESARVAGLRYADDSRPGISRRRAGRSTSYRAPDGRPIRERAELARIRSLAIPPAWTDVWINPDPNGHILATGRDARGRKQYRYHPRWREVRDETKYARMSVFAEALSGMRARVDADLARPGIPRERVLAVVVRLLEVTQSASATASTRGTTDRSA